MDFSDIYGPIGADLPKVEQAIQEVGEVDYPWLATLLRHVLGQPGKRMRPAMTLLGGRFHSYNLDLLVPMAAAAELLHTATLVHDDTLDAASLRRGNPTVNTVWNNTTAVLFGDYLFAAAAEMVSRTANVRVMRLFAQTLLVICDGELAQQYAAYRCDTPREQYYQRIGKKTASLFAMATESGAVLSGAPEPDVQALKEYGYKLGIAFQIADDILDFTGEEATLGKPVGSDLLQGTMTLPAILLTERYPAHNPVRDYVEHGRKAGDVQRAVEAIHSERLIAASQEIADQFCREALDALRIFPDTPARGVLADLVSYTVHRDR